MNESSPITAVPRPDNHVDRFVFVTMAVILRRAIARRHGHHMNAEILQTGGIAQRLVDSLGRRIDEMHSMLACHGGDLFSG